MGSAFRRHDRQRTPERRMRVPRAIWEEPVSVGSGTKVRGEREAYEKGVEDRKEGGLVKVDQAIQYSNNIIHTKYKRV